MTVEYLHIWFATIYFSRVAIPVYRSCGDWIVGGGKNLAVAVEIGIFWCSFWRVHSARLYFNLSDRLKLRMICCCILSVGVVGVGAKLRTCNSGNVR